MRVAAVDIGTNTARVLVADRVPDETLLAPVRRLSTVTRLGRGVDATGRLDPEAIGETLAVLRRYRGIIDAAGAQTVQAVATSAVREAEDREGFLDAAAKALGVRPRPIGGEEEARLSFRGVSHGLGEGGAILVIDPGGGSTEFVIGELEPTYTVSLDIGSVRLTERHLPRHPAPAEHVAAARAEVDAYLGAVRLPVPPAVVAGVGGTFTSLAAILLDLTGYDAVRVHGSSFVTGDFVEIVDRLSGLSVPETAAIPSLDRRRAPVLLGGGIVVCRSLQHVGADRVVVSQSDILDGVALEWGTAP